MQALIIVNTEEPELEQLTLSGSSFLPLGNELLLTYLIRTFIESGVYDIIIVHSDTQLGCLTNYIETKHSLWPSCVKINFCELPKYSTLPESLHRLKHLLLSDYVFITYSTTIISDLNLRNVFLSMIRNKSSMVAVFSALPTTESKVFKSLARDLVVYSGASDNLVAYFASSDIKKQTKLPRTLLVSHRNISCRSDLRDCRFYLLTRSAVNHIASKRLVCKINFASIIREDIGTRKKSIWNYLLPESCQQTIGTDFIEESMKTDLTDKGDCDFFYLYLKNCGLNGISIYEHSDTILSTRIDDPLVYVEASRLFIQKQVAMACQGNKKGNIDKESNLIQLNCEIDSKSFINCSYIGMNCIIGKNSRILNSVLLSNVVIKENSAIQNCILGEKVVIDSDCNLRSCAVAALQRVPDGTNLESEQLGFSDPELSATQT